MTFAQLCVYSHTMTIIFRTIHPTDSPYWVPFVAIYSQSFPIDEQRPTHDIARLIEADERYTAHAIIDAESEQFLGLLTTWHLGDFIYIEHFALSPQYRSQGYGSNALKKFIHEHPMPIILEAEPPTDALTRRRVQFYERNGLTLYEYDYIQPPYTPERQPVPLRLMGTLPSTMSLADVALCLHREVYGSLLVP